MLADKLRAATAAAKVKPEVASYSFTQNTASIATVNIAKPSGVAVGDLLIAMLGVRASTAPNGPSWVTLSGWSLAYDWWGEAVQYKIASGSEPATYTFTGTYNANTSVGYIFRVTNGWFDKIDTTEMPTAEHPLTVASVGVNNNNTLAISYVRQGYWESQIITTASPDWTLLAQDADATGPSSVVYYQYTSSATDSATYSNAGLKTMRAHTVCVKEPGGLLLSYLSTGDSANVTTFTRTAVSFGDAAADRFIVVTIMARGEISTPAGMTATSITIGGVAATVAESQAPDSIGDYRPYSVIAYAKVPTGTSGDIVVVSTAQCDEIAVSAYRVISATGSLSVVASSEAVNVSDSNTSLPLSTSVATVNGGIMIATTMSTDGAISSSTTMTEDYEADLRTNEIANSFSKVTDGTSVNPSIVREAGTIPVGGWCGTVVSFSA